MCVSTSHSHLLRPHYAMYFIHIILEVAGITPILQMDKLRFGEMKWLPRVTQVISGRPLSSVLHCFSGIPLHRGLWELRAFLTFQVLFGNSSVSVLRLFWFLCLGLQRQRGNSDFLPRCNTREGYQDGRGPQLKCFSEFTLKTQQARTSKWTPLGVWGEFSRWRLIDPAGWLSLMVSLPAPEWQHSVLLHLDSGNTFQNVTYILWACPTPHPDRNTCK